MQTGLIIGLLAGMLHAATAQDPPAQVIVCFKNPDALKRDTLISAEHTLRRVEKRLGAPIRTVYGECPQIRAFMVGFVANPPAIHPPDVLGATRTAGDAILPDTRIFFRSAAAMLRNPSDQNQGIALGNIIAHELYHYLKQTRHHDGMDLNCEFLTERQLLATR